MKLLHIIINWLAWLLSPLWILPALAVTAIFNAIEQGRAGWAYKNFVHGERWWWE